GRTPRVTLALEELVLHAVRFSSLRELDLLLFGLSPFGQVARHLREADELTALVMKRGDDHVGPELRAVLANSNAFVLEASFPRGHFELLVDLALSDVLFGVEGRQVSPDDLVRRVPLDALGAHVPRGDMTARVEQVDRVVLDALDQ